MHEYFYGAQSSTYSFIRVPTVLFTDDQYKYVSAEAKVLYGLLLARMDLSAKNGWLDDQGRVYIICTLSEIMEKLNCADNKATKLMNELEEKCGLIERKRQGLGKPTLDFDVTPHLLRHTYITNLIHEGVDPKTVQYLAGHENSKVTMDIYAKVKYNKPEQLSSVVNGALKLPSKRQNDVSENATEDTEIS